MRRFLLLIPTILLVALLGLAAPAHASGSNMVTTSTLAELEPDRGITNCVNSNPLPGCGRAPTNSGDPGGSGQMMLFGFLIVGMLTIAVVVVRSTMRTTRARRAAAG